MASTRPGVRVGGHQRDSGQAAGHQVPEERQPAGPVLGAADVQAEDLPIALGVDRSGDQRVHVDRAPALPDFEHQRVGGPECVRPGV
jgi:hypothetical protein